MIVFITTGMDLPIVKAAVRQLPVEFPPVESFSLYGAKLDEIIEKTAVAAKLFVVRANGGKAQFREDFAALADFCGRREVPLIVLPGDCDADLEIMAQSSVNLAEVQAAFAYLAAGGVENYYNLLLRLANKFLGANHNFAQPVALPKMGLYHSRARDKDVCAEMSLADFQREFWQPERPALGVLFYSSLWVQNNLAPVNALIDEIERRGANALPIFCSNLFEQMNAADAGGATVFSEFLMPDGVSQVDAIITGLGFSMFDVTYGERGTTSGGTGADLVEKLNVPFIQTILIYQKVDEWKTSLEGLTAHDALLGVVMPEFDGRIIGAPYSFLDADDKTDADGTRFSIALADRTRAVVALALRHAALKRKQNSEKRIAVVLNNASTSNAKIGSASGLDTPYSAIAILHALKNRGYAVENIPTDGDTMMADIIAAGGYETEFLSDAQMENSVAKFSAGRYQRWFDEFPAASQTALREKWDAPPGKMYRSNGNVYAAGVQFGNVALMIQPPRGYGEKPEAIYHADDLLPPHQYLGMYRWLRDEFRADAIIHLGTHGTLEWLPGKALGMSENCSPDLAIADFPVFHPYIINNPGEGAQAKRRMQSCLIGHLIPPMQQAETYNELTKLQDLLAIHANAAQFNRQKLPHIREEIWKIVVAANLQTDFDLTTEPPADADFPEFLEKLEGYLHELGDAQIKDGMHYFAELQTGEQLIGLTMALVRLDAPGVTGLRRAVAEDFELDFEIISRPETLGRRFEYADSPAFFNHLPEKTTRRTNGDFLYAIEQFSRRLIEELNSRDFAPAEVREIIAEFDLPETGKTAATLQTLAEIIVPNLRRTSDEMTNLLDGLEGGFVTPGPSGAPTRGMFHVLPTGRNFYTVDPRAIPSPFAWRVGQKLGDGLIEKYRAEHGDYPENVGLTMWATSNMRTQGDDIAEFLWLLGVRPVWQQENNRVTGLEIISLEELKRPRIDVMVRLTGFFRDSFPGLMKLMDDAVQMVAELDEPEEMNFVRRNIQAETRARVARGETAERARQRAAFRIFSNKPGTHIPGIDKAIEQRNWETKQNLADIYLAWAAYAYDGKGVYGESAKEEMTARLAVTQVASQNQDNREHDILDNDDYFSFFGGMVVAITAITGNAPTAIFGDSANPEKARVRDLQDEANRVFRSRVVNPNWIESVKRHGYKGAMELAETVDYLFGFDATADVMRDWMYERVTEEYLFDDDTRQFLETSNPWAIRDMSSRLLEAAERGMWENPKPETIEQLKEMFLANEGMIEAQSEIQPNLAGGVSA